jgi:hypothetical protein
VISCAVFGTASRAGSSRGRLFWETGMKGFDSPCFNCRYGGPTHKRRFRRRRAALKDTPPAQPTAFQYWLAFFGKRGEGFGRNAKMRSRRDRRYPARSAGVVERICDFSRPIVGLGDNVACTIVSPERGSSRARLSED